MRFGEKNRETSSREKISKLRKKYFSTEMVNLSVFRPQKIPLANDAYGPKTFLMAPKLLWPQKFSRSQIFAYGPKAHFCLWPLNFGAAGQYAGSCAVG